MRTMHLFAGAGGGLLADLILGHRPTVAVEWDAARAALLASRTEWFPELEVIRADIRQLDARGWAGKVDCIHAGIPCPRWSSARRGAGDPDDYWPEVLRITGDVRPGVLFLESVPGIQREHRRFRDDLERIGYTLGDGIVTDACSVGAPHLRQRYWSLGYADENGKPRRVEHGEAPWLPQACEVDWWQTDPRNLRMDDGDADRMDRLGMCGDAQVPLQAALAWRILGGP